MNLMDALCSYQCLLVFCSPGSLWKQKKASRAATSSARTVCSADNVWNRNDKKWYLCSKCHVLARSWNSDLLLLVLQVWQQSRWWLPEQRLDLKGQFLRQCSMTEGGMYVDCRSLLFRVRRHVWIWTFRLALSFTKRCFSLVLEIKVCYENSKKQLNFIHILYLGKEITNR